MVFQVCFFEKLSFHWHHSFVHVERGYSEIHVSKCRLYFATAKMAIFVSKNYFFCARFLGRWVEWCWIQRNGEFDINQVLIVEPVSLIGDLREAETFFSRLWGHSNSQELFWSRTRSSFGSCSSAFLNLSRTCPMTLRTFISVLKNARKFPKRSIKNVLKSARELPKRSIKNVLKSAREHPKRSIKNIEARWQAERKPQKRRRNVTTGA